MPIGAVSAAPDIDIDDAILARVQIIRHAEGWRKLNGPVTRFECRVAVEELKAELQRLARRKLFRTTKKLAAQRIHTTDTGWRRRPSLFDIRAAHGSQNHEELIALYRVITFQDVLIVRIPPPTAFERNVATTSAPIAISIGFRKSDTPTIGRLPSLRRRHWAGWRWRNRDINHALLSRFDNQVLECVTTDDRKVAVVLIFIELCGVGLVQSKAIGAGRQRE